MTVVSGQKTGRVETARLAIDAGEDFDAVMAVGRERLDGWRATARDRWLYE